MLVGSNFKLLNLETIIPERNFKMVTFFLKKPPESFYYSDQRPLRIHFKGVNEYKWCFNIQKKTCVESHSHWPWPRSKNFILNHMVLGVLDAKCIKSYRVVELLLDWCVDNLVSCLRLFFSL